MSDTVDVAIPVETRAATALRDAATRSLVGRVVSRMLEPASVERLMQAVAALKAEAQARGLTDAIIDAELAAYNAERQEADTAPGA